MLNNWNLWKKTGVGANYSKPMQLCNQSTNSTNKNTSTGKKKEVLNFKPVNTVLTVELYL